MTADTPEQDVRELAKAAVATIRQQARRIWNGGVIMLTSDGEIADAVLAAVTPVIRRQEREATEATIADLDRRLDEAEMRAHVASEANRVLRDALAARPPSIVLGEEIAQAIHERFDHLKPEWHSDMISVAEWCEHEVRRRAAAIARSHSTGKEEDRG